MATVYRAWQPSLERYVAIKVLLPHLSRNRDFVRRFQHEATVAASLSHPSIVTIYDVGEQDGWVYIAMEYVDGRPLSSLIRREGPLPLDRAVRILGQVAGALDHAHRRHFVHRDIKPANILVTADDRVVLTDFGIAKALHGSGATAELTADGTILGTPAYMSPEQIEGRTLDYRTDLYSLGIVAYEMLGGAPPFKGLTTASLLYAQVYTPAPDIRQVNPVVTAGAEAALARMLSKDPMERFASASEFVEALGAVTAPTVQSPGPPIGAGVPRTPVSSRRGSAQPPLTPVGSVPSPRPSKQRWRGLAFVLSALAVVVALGLAAVMLWKPWAQEDPADQAGVVTVVVLPGDTNGAPSGGEIPVTVASDSAGSGLDAGVEMVPRSATDRATEPAPTAMPTEAAPTATPHRFSDLPASLAFHSNRDGDNEIYVLDVESGEIRQLTHNTADDIRPDWSPDGTRIAFQSDRDGNYEIYVMDAYGNNASRLTYDEGRDMRPVWSIDGQSFLFLSDRTGDPEIFVMDVDGQNAQNLTQNPARDWAPAWSPDNREILFMSDRDVDDGTYEIYRQDLADGATTRLTDNAFTDWMPSWSPDGEWIVFASDRAEGDWEIFVMDAEGEAIHLRRLTENPGMDWWPMWSWDGSKIAFASEQGGALEIHVMDPDGGSQERLAEGYAEADHPRWARIR